MSASSNENSVADADVAQLAARIDANTIDLQAQLEAFGQKALETVDRLQEAKRELLRDIHAYRVWLSERADWLKNERMKGGNWEYLKNKEEETRHCLEKLHLFVPAVAS